MLVSLYLYYHHYWQVTQLILLQVWANFLCDMILEPECTLRAYMQFV